MPEKSNRIFIPPVPQKPSDVSRPLPSWRFWSALIGVIAAAGAVWGLRSHWRETSLPQPEQVQVVRREEVHQEVVPVEDPQIVRAETTSLAEFELHLQDLPKDVLDPTKQKYIWDAEHITFEIEKRFGKGFKAALAARDKQRLSGLFRDGFRGQVIDKRRSMSERRKGLVTERRLGGSDTASGSSDSRSESASMKTVNAAELIDDLLVSLAPFDTIENVGLRVLKIERRDADSGQRWSTQLLLTAFGNDANGGLLALDSLQHVVFQYQAKEEIDGGRVVSQWDVSAERLRACPRMLMEEVTEQTGLAKLPLLDNWLTEEMPQQFRFQMAVEDFDRDGYLDIAMASVHGFPILLRSIRGERFEDVTESFGLATWSPQEYRYLATWIDYDNDDYPDLILGSRLYRNVNGVRFEDVTDPSGLRFGQRPMGCAVADYDGDGLLDIYVLYQYSTEQKRSGTIPWVGDDSSGQENRLWHNEGNGRFRNVTQVSGAAGGQRNSFAATWLYADQDQLPDLYVANDFGTNVMLRNRGDGSFEDISQAAGVADYATSMGVAAGDVDNDGLPELYVANMYSKMGRRIIAHVCDDDYDPGIYEQIKGACAGNRLYRRSTEDQRYEDLSTALGVNGIGWAFAPAMVDLDNDGLLDMYATTGFMSFDRHKPDG